MAQRFFMFPRVLQIAEVSDHTGCVTLFTFGWEMGLGGVGNNVEAGWMDGWVREMR